ncbi:hypothetical protein VUR80DRAFT_7834 [Thermomyces stellatus]
MSSNVGLPTPRGSGTSGYVQRNLAHMKPRDYGTPYPQDAESRQKLRKPDKDILEHDAKREVELKVIDLQDELEEEGLDEEEIEKRCDELRAKLLADLKRNGAGSAKRSFKSHEVHGMADAKIKESERLRSALKISKDYQEGDHWRRQEERARGLAGEGGEKERGKE